MGPEFLPSKLQGCQYMVTQLASRRDFSFFSLVARPLGLSCGLSPTSVCGPTMGWSWHQGCLGALSSALLSTGHGGGKLPVWFCPQAFLVADFLPPIPSGCLLTPNSSPPPRLALQSPHSGTQPSCMLADMCIPGLSKSVQGGGRDCLCRSNSVLFCHRPAVSLSFDSSDISFCPN